jgi:fluoride exporter
MEPDLRGQAPLVAAVSAGGVRSTWAVNVSGCFLIGVLMVLVERRLAGRRLVRPFLAVGVLGGYTTFSTSVVDAQQARPAVALLYLGATVVGALLAVAAGTALASAVVRTR